MNSLRPAPVSGASFDALSLLVCSPFSADPEGTGPRGCLSPGPAGQDLSLGPQALVKLPCAGGRLTPSQLPSLPGRPCPPWPLLLGSCPLLSCFAHGTVSQFQIPPICHAAQVSLQPGPCLPHPALSCPVSGSCVVRVSSSRSTPAPLQSPSSLTSPSQMPVDASALDTPPPQPGPHLAPWFCLPEHRLPVPPRLHASRAPLPAPPRVPRPCLCPSTSPEHPCLPLHPEVAARLTNPSACFRDPRAENSKGTRARPGVLGLTCVCM